MDNRATGFYIETHLGTNKNFIKSEVKKETFHVQFWFSQKKKKT